MNIKILLVFWNHCKWANKPLKRSWLKKQPLSRVRKTWTHRCQEWKKHDRRNDTSYSWSQSFSEAGKRGTRSSSGSVIHSLPLHQMRSRFIRQPGQESFRLVRRSKRNHDNYAAATQPLIKVVDNLCTLANSPDFASILVKISPTARQYQKPYTSVGKTNF